MATNQDIRDANHLTDFVEALQDACKDAEIDLTELESVNVQNQAMKYLYNQPIKL